MRERDEEREEEECVRVRGPKTLIRGDKANR